MTPEPLYADNPTARVSYDGGVTWIECDVTLNDDNGVYIDASIPTDGISAEDLFAELGLDDAAGGDTEIG